MIGMFMVHTVSVRTKTGEGSYGPVYADAVVVPGVQVDEDMRLVRTGDGSEQTSSTTVRGPLVHADKFVVGSRVTLQVGGAAACMRRRWRKAPRHGGT